MPVIIYWKNRNGDGISIATVCLIMVSTIVLLAVLKKLYSICTNCYVQNRARFHVDYRRPIQDPINQAEAVNMQQVNRQNDQDCQGWIMPKCNIFFFEFFFMYCYIYSNFAVAGIFFYPLFSLSAFQIW